MIKEFVEESRKTPFALISLDVPHIKIERLVSEVVLGTAHLLFSWYVTIFVVIFEDADPACESL